MDSAVYTLGLAASFVAGSYAIGQALDQFATTETKSQIVALVKTPRNSIVETAINTIVDGYHRIFSRKIFSREFFSTSIYVYVFLFLAFCLSSYIFDRAALYINVSSFLYGDLVDVISVISAFIAGGFLFFLGNAQTLFFLRLVRLDPRLISSALVLYADLLLTVSLCIIGVGLIVSGLALTELSRSLRSRVQFQVISTKQNSIHAKVYFN